MDATLLEGVEVSLALGPLAWIAIGQAALTLYDQYFGTGKDNRDARDSALSLAEQEARSKLKDDETRRERSAEQYGAAKEGFDNPKLPPEFVDFSKVLEQFIPGINTSAVDMEALAPGLIRGQMFNRMQANVDPGQTSQGSISNLLAATTNASNLSEAQASQVLGNLMWSFLNQKSGSSTSPITTPGMEDAAGGLLGTFFNPYQSSYGAPTSSQPLQISPTGTPSTF